MINPSINSTEEENSTYTSQNKGASEKRDQFRVQMRREDRKDEIHKRRMPLMNTKKDNKDEEKWTHMSHLPDFLEQKKVISGIYELEFDEKKLDELAKILLSNTDDFYQLHYSLIGIRKILCLTENNPIQEVIDYNLPQKFIDFMSYEKYPHLILEATWCCCNISTGNSNQIQRLIDKGLIPKLVKLLECNSMEIFEQASWCAANIAADCYEFKRLLINSGVVQPLVSKLIIATNMKQVGQIVWSLSNVCRGKVPDLKIVQQAAPAFIKCILFCTDADIQSDALQGLCDVSNELLTPLLSELALLVKLREISALNQKNITIPLLKILGFVTNGTDEQTQRVIDAGFLEFFFMLLKTPNTDK